jgi:hypothetical protein
MSLVFIRHRNESANKTPRTALSTVVLMKVHIFPEYFSPVFLLCMMFVTPTVLTAVYLGRSNWPNIERRCHFTFFYQDNIAVVTVLKFWWDLDFTTLKLFLLSQNQVICHFTMSNDLPRPGVAPPLLMYFRVTIQTELQTQMKLLIIQPQIFCSQLHMRWRRTADTCILTIFRPWSFWPSVRVLKCMTKLTVKAWESIA